jgi:hypothetical protein
LLRIGALIGDGRDEVSKQLSPVGTIDWFERPEALVGRATEGVLDAIVTDLQDRDGRSIAPTIVGLAAYRPTLPVLLYARIDRAAIDALLAVFALGLRMECAVRPFVRLAPVLRYMLSPAYRPGVAPLLFHHLMPHVPAALTTFVVLAMLSAPARRGVEELATWTGSSIRTLERHLHDARWPTARVVMKSFTALDAVWLMTEYRWSARRVHVARAFPHPSAVTRLLATYAATTPATLIEDGGFDAALAHVTRVLVAHTRR